MATIKKVSKGTLSPKKNSVSKNVGNLNKAQAGAELNKKYDAAYKVAQKDSTDDSNSRNKLLFQFLKAKNPNSPVTDDQLTAAKRSVDAARVNNSNIGPLNARRNALNKMKTGGKVASVKPKAGTHKMPDGSIMKNSMMKAGGKMKKGKC